MEKLKKEVFKRFFEYDDKSLLEEAYKIVIDTRPLQKEEVVRTMIMDRKRLFCKIDETIAYLNELKSQGYEEIEEFWYGYEDNDFLATRPDVESNIEFYDRIAEWVSEEYDNLVKEKEKEEQRKQKIAKLKEELRKLEK